MCLKHQAISVYSADKMLIILDEIYTKLLH